VYKGYIDNKKVTEGGTTWAGLHSVQPPNAGCTNPQPPIGRGLHYLDRKSWTAYFKLTPLASPQLQSSRLNSSYSAGVPWRVSVGSRLWLSLSSQLVPWIERTFQRFVRGLPAELHYTPTKFRSQWVGAHKGGQGGVWLLWASKAKMRCIALTCKTCFTALVQPSSPATLSRRCHLAQSQSIDTLTPHHQVRILHTHACAGAQRRQICRHFDPGNSARNAAPANSFPGSASEAAPARFPLLASHVPSPSSHGLILSSRKTSRKRLWEAPPF
jgi:hypothetical protein